MPKSSVEQLRDNLTEIEDIKGQIRQAIIAKETEVPLDTPFSEYPQKIEDIQTKEDLDNVLNIQDERIAELEKALENKTAGFAKINIYCQLEEPTDKKGIWLKADKAFDKVITETNIAGEEKWNKLKAETLKSIPYNIYYGNSFKIGNYIYILYSTHSGSSETYFHIMEYNIETDTYKNIANNTNGGSFIGNCTAVVGNDLYIFFKYDYVAKFNVVSKEWTRLSSYPSSEFTQSSSTVSAIGTDIYIFGGAHYNSPAYKYDTLTDTYTEINHLDRFTGGVSIAFGTDVYLFGAFYYNNSWVYYAKKYDTLTDRYSNLKAPSFVLNNTNPVLYGTNIYMFGDNDLCYKYNILTNEYTKLENPPYQAGDKPAALYLSNGEIYIFGGSTSKTRVQIYNIELLNTYPDNSIVISQGVPVYHTEIMETDIENGLQFYFNDIWHYTTDKKFNENIPTYYGNGTQWIKFKN